jgi:hypothetical protein
MVKRSAKRRKTSDKPSAKRGNPGYFAGAPLALLESFLPEYISQRNDREQFWVKFKGKWLTEYPPNLTDKEKVKVVRLIEKYNLDGRGRKKKLKAEDEEDEEGEAEKDKEEDGTVKQVSAADPGPDSELNENTQTGGQ